MAEFALLAPLIVVMWMGMEYFRKGYETALTTLASSQKQAWSRAYPNELGCHQGIGNYLGVLAAAGAETAGGDAAGDSVGDFASAERSGSTDSSMFLYADATGRSPTRSVESNQLYGLKLQASLRSKTFLTCNEVVPHRGHGEGIRPDENVITPLKTFVSSLINR